jgi:hypothetical protein
MFRNVWLYIALVAAITTGGWFYVVHYAPTNDPKQNNQPEPSQGASASPNTTDEELARKRQEGIGTIKDLRSVPISGSGHR